MTQSATPELDLATLRVDIDRIDAEMHRLLMERGEIIDRLIGVKARQGGGSAFRPGREADMMRRFVERHRGILPLDTVEGIWRIIIATFTYVQSNYSVHVDASGGDAPMRDTARFHFGFTVPYISHEGPAKVIDAVAGSDGDLGILKIDAGIAAGPWWDAMAEPEMPKVIARLPFVDRPDHPANLPVFVISKPLAEAAATDVAVYGATLSRWRQSIGGKISSLNGEVLVNVGTDNGLSLLVSAPCDVSAQQIAEALDARHPDEIRLRKLGSHAARHTVRSKT